MPVIVREWMRERWHPKWWAQENGNVPNMQMAERNKIQQRYKGTIYGVSCSLALGDGGSLIRQR